MFRTQHTKRTVKILKPYNHSVSLLLHTGTQRHRLRHSETPDSYRYQAQATLHTECRSTQSFQACGSRAHGASAMPDTVARAHQAQQNIIITPQGNHAVERKTPAYSVLCACSSFVIGIARTACTASSVFGACAQYWTCTSCTTNADTHTHSLWRWRTMAHAGHYAPGPENRASSSNTVLPRPCELRDQIAPRSASCATHRNASRRSQARVIGADVRCLGNRFCE